MSLILGDGSVTFGDSTVQSTAADGLLSDGYRHFQIFNNFGLFTVPSDCKQIRVRVVGGGGGGGLKAGGGGGGGGGYVCAEFKIGNGTGEIAAGTTIPVDVGIGGKTQFNVTSAGAYTAAINSNYTSLLIDSNYTTNFESEAIIVSEYYVGAVGAADDVSVSFGETALVPTVEDTGYLVNLTGTELQAKTTFLVDGSASSFGNYLMASGGSGGGFTAGGNSGIGSDLGNATALNLTITQGGKGGAGGGVKTGTGATSVYHGGGGGGSAGGIHFNGTVGGFGNMFGGGGGGGIGGRGSNPIPNAAAGGGGSYGGSLNQYGGPNSLRVSNMVEYSSILDAFTPVIGTFPFQIFTGGGGFMNLYTPYNGGVGGGGCGGYIRALLAADTGDYTVNYAETLVRSGSNGGIGGGGGGGSPRRASKHFITGSLRLRGYGGAGNGGIGAGGGGSCGDSDFTAGLGGNGVVVVEWK